MEVKILVDDMAYKRYFAQHGLSIIVKTENKKILFDVGQNPYVLNKNLKIMGENDNFDSIIISHGHYDHTDGLSYFMKHKKDDSKNELDIDIPIYVHPDAFLDRYSQSKKYIGIDKNIKEALKNYKHLVLVDKPYFEDNIVISGKIERNSIYEPELFYRLTSNNNKNNKNDKNVNFEIDEVNDDMFMIVDDIIVTGCSHSGIINVIEYAKKINKGKIRGVIGGFHLVVSSDEYINKVYEYLKCSDLEFIMPIHCTGFKAMKILSNLDNFIYGHVGKTLKI